MTRILYFTRDYTPHDHRFLTALGASGHEVFSLRLERRGMQREDRPLPPGVEQITWGGGLKPAELRDYPRLQAELRKIIQRVKPDVIHAGPIQSAALLAALTGFRPLVSMSWGSDLLMDAEQMKFRTRYTLRHSTVLVGDCQAVADKASEFGFPAERVVLFPWGVDLQHFAPGDDAYQRSELGWEDAFTLLCLRSWEPLYGVEVVARAFARAAQQLPELRLFLLGGGSQAPLLRQVLMQAGVIERVVFGGQVGQANLPKYYRAADLYISASHSDGSSVSLMEALACGVPVLVSDIAGNKEWITPGQEGWLFRDGDDEALTRGILNAVQMREQLGDMRIAARKLAEERADWNKNFQKLLEAYDLAIQLARKGKLA